jgi:hypothetical protein
MRITVKAFLILSLILGFALSLNPNPVLANQIQRQALDGGGDMWLSTTNYKLSSSLGQSITGTQGGATKKVYTGFWNPWVVVMSPVEQEEEDLNQLPKEFELSQNYPNPFNPATVIEYALPKSSDVKIKIYNILGQEVRNLVNERQEAGYKIIGWDGKDDQGREISSGIYFYRIVAGNFVKAKKMVLLK